MKKEIVIRTPYCIEKCQKTVLQAIGKVPGVDQVFFDNATGTVTLIGDIDITKVEKNLKNQGKKMDILSLQLHTKEEKPQSKPADQPDAKKTDEKSDINNLHVHCNGGKCCCKCCGNTHRVTDYCVVM